MLTLEIAGRSYRVEVEIDRITVERADGTRYTIGREPDPARSCRLAVACDCPDFQYRHAGLPTDGCKHVGAAWQAGLLPANL